MKKIFSLLAVTGLLLGCGKNLEKTNLFSVDPVEASIESGLTMMSAMADEQTGASLAARTNKTEMYSSPWQFILGSNAYAESCSRPFYASCIGGVRTANYSNCEIADSNRTLSGQVNLNYSNSSCMMSSAGDSVVRSYDVSVSGPRGGVVSHTSQSKTDYRGIQYQGGGSLTKNSSGWSMEILGRHSILNFKSRSLFDVSLRTLSAIAITGGLERNVRQMNGGQIEVNHNLAKFTSVITPNNLRWSNTCCHPTSGSLSVTYSGSKTGSATVTFNGCGSATADQNGQSTNIELTYCE